MKRFLAIVLAVSLLCGCTASPATDGKNTQPSMAEEENPMEIDLTQQRCADQVNLNFIYKTLLSLLNET